MQKVWKCDYCCETGKSWFKMAQHEKNCDFNPINKYCQSCKNYINDGFYTFGERYLCKVELNTNNGNCIGWSNEII